MTQHTPREMLTISPHTEKVHSTMNRITIYLRKMLMTDSKQNN